jgi:hypothetical protein
MPEIVPNAGVTHEPCRLLRSKWMFIQVEPDPSIPHSDSGICWCVHTLNCLGPDGGIVTREDCKPGRTCYESA